MAVQTFCKKCSRREGDAKIITCPDCDQWYHLTCTEQDEAGTIKNWVCRTCNRNDQSSKVHETPSSSLKKTESVKDDKASTKLVTALEQSLIREKAWLAEKEAMAKRIEELEQAMESIKVNENVSRLLKSLDNVSENQRINPDDLEAERAERERIERALEDADNMSRVGSTRNSRISHHSNNRSSNEQYEQISNSASHSEINAVSGVEKYLIRQELQKLPEFSGDVESWSNFVKIYNETSRDGHFSEIENLNRLKTAIKSPAKDLIGVAMKGNTTAKRIMAALENMYGRTDILLGKYTKDLLNVPTITSKTDANIKKFAMKLSDYVGLLKDLKMESSLDNAAMESVLIQKLEKAPSIYSRWMNFKKTKKVNIEDFAIFITQLWTEMPPDQRDSKTKNEVRVKSSMAHHVEPVKNQRSSLKCTCCDTVGHGIWKCKIFLDKSFDERMKMVKEKRLCFSCLFPDHPSVECKYKKECNIDGCGQQHHRLIHAKNSNPKPSAPVEDNKEAQKVSQVSIHGNGGVMTKIVPVRLYGNNGNFVETYAFLDDGSQVTMIEKDVVKSLNLKGKSETLTLQWTQNVTRQEKSLRSSLKISGMNGPKKYNFENVYIIGNLNLPKRSQDGHELSKKFKHLKNLKIPTFKDVTPRMIIGADQANFIIGSKSRMGGENEPTALKTRFGWTVMGNNVDIPSVVSLSHFHAPTVTLSYHEATVDDSDLHELVKRHFTTENFGVSPSSKVLKSRDDEKAEKTMNETLKFIDGRYEIGLLWKENNEVPENTSYDMAVKRLVNLENSLKKDENSMVWMNNHVNELVEKGYARVATEDDLNTRWKRVWYCPTFVVVNKNKNPPKPRCVWDTAAKSKGISLNSNLLPGPDNLAPLMGGLARFREQKIAVNGDVKEMFHQIRIKKEDQQCQRFLWRNCDQSQKPKVYIMQSMMFGPTCSPSEAQFVKNTHAEKYRKECPEAVDGLQNFTYVDDYFNSHASVEEAIRVTKDAIKICDDMKFDLVNFQSNSSELLNSIPRRNVKEQMIDLDNDNVNEIYTKILGMHWDAKNDVFVYKRKNDELMKSMMTENYVPTKREVLQIVMRMFDPLGFISKYLIRGKMILQEVWRYGIGWDEKIPAELAEKWQRFVKTLDVVERVKVSRNYAPVDPRSCSQVQLITFVDASDSAFAAVSYFRFETENDVFIAIAGAKAKVAPVNPLTIPRLELQAAVLGVRLAKMIQSITSFQIHEKKYLSDSTCVLNWICKIRTKQQMFIGSRIGEILDKSSSHEWYHVRSKLNVADEATKVTKEEDDEENSRWFQGPDFMKLPQDQWPIEHAIEKFEDHDSIATMSHHIAKSDDIIDRMKWNFKYNWKKCVHVIAFSKRFINGMRKMKQLSDQVITPDEFDRAEIVIFKKIQHEVFSDEIQKFKKMKEKEQPDVKVELNSSSPLYSLRPFLDEEDVIRMKSRKTSSELSYSSKNPIILPKSHEFVQLMWKHLHVKNHHTGIEKTIADGREKAWIISARDSLLKVTKHCQVCEFKNAVPSLPVFGDLHISRQHFESPPFTHVGVDCFGPLIVKQGRSKVKRWGVIFTCLTYRAVHLEIINEMSTDKMMMAIRRTIIAKGKIDHLYSDNGTNFVGSSNQMKKDLKEITEEMSKKVADDLRITWHFLAAFQPWSGGAWERLVQSVKRVMKFCIEQETPEEDVLRNAFAEAELIINNRPLTHTPIDPDDEEPITPNLIMFGKRVPSSFTTTFDETAQFSRNRRDKVESLSNHFASRWVREYLAEIGKPAKKEKGAQGIEIGSVVIVTEPNQPRDAWKMGRIINIYPTKDEIPRVVDVKLSNGDVKIKRAVGRLIILKSTRESSK